MTKKEDPVNQNLTERTSELGQKLIDMMAEMEVEGGRVWLENHPETLATRLKEAFYDAMDPLSSGAKVAGSGGNCLAAEELEKTLLTIIEVKRCLATLGAEWVEGGRKEIIKVKSDSMNAWVMDTFGGPRAPLTERIIELATETMSVLDLLTESITVRRQTLANPTKRRQNQ
jgi:hypothetical protein